MATFAGKDVFAALGPGRFGAADVGPPNAPLERHLVAWDAGDVDGSAIHDQAGSWHHDGPQAAAASRQARGLSTSSGTDSALITPNDVASGGVIAFRAQSASTRIRFPGMADRW